MTSPRLLRRTPRVVLTALTATLMLLLGQWLNKPQPALSQGFPFPPPVSHWYRFYLPSVLRGVSTDLEPRSGHDAVLLQDGRVMVVGGQNAVAVFDPRTEWWQFEAPPPHDAQPPKVTRLADGSVLVVGTVQPTPRWYHMYAQRFDPIRNTWSVTAPVDIGWKYFFGSDLTVTPLDGNRVLAFATYSTKYGPEPWASVYDVNTGGWSDAHYAYGSFPVPCSTATGLTDGKVLVVGFGDGRPQVFDPQTTTWSFVPPPSRTHIQYCGGPAILLADGRVLVVGMPDEPNLNTVAEIFDPSTNVWIDAGTLPIRLQSSLFRSALLQDERVLLTNGDVTFLYDPTKNRWSQGGKVGTTRSQFTLTALPDGRAVMIGGSANKRNVGDVEVFDPKTRKWRYAGRRLP